MNNSNLVEFIEEPEEFYKMISQNVKKLRQKYKYTQLDFSANIGFNSVSFFVIVKIIKMENILIFYI